MKRLALFLCFSASGSAFAATFKLEGYQEEVNDGTVVRKSATLKDVGSVRFRCCRVSDASLQQISKWPRLRGVYLHDTAVTGAGFTYLQDHDQLKQVLLHGPNVNDDGVRVLGRLTHVTHLHVGNGYRWDGLVYEPLITDAALESIGRMKTVQFLSIDNARITDAGILHLGNLPKVRNIQFYRCPELTADGLDRLRKLLPKATIRANDPESGKKQ